MFRGEERSVFGVLRGCKRGVDFLQFELGLFVGVAQLPEDGLALLVAVDGQQPTRCLRHSGQQSEECHGRDGHDAEHPSPGNVG